MYERIVQNEPGNLRVLRIINNCILAYTISLMLILLVLPSAPVMFVSNLCMVLLVLALEFLQDHVKSFLWYALGQLGCLWALFLFSPTVGEAGIRFAVGVVAILVGLVARIRMGYAIYPHWPLVLVGLGVFLTAVYMDNAPLMYLGYGMEITYVIMVLLYYNAVSLHHAIERSPSGSKVPMEKIRTSNRAMMGIYLTAAGVLIGISTLFTFGPLILKGLAFVLRLIVKGIIEVFVFLSSLLPGSYGTVDLDAWQRFLEQMGGQNVNPVWQVILLVLQIVFAVIIMFVILRLVLGFARDMYSSFTTAEIGTVEEKVFEEPKGEEKSAPAVQESRRFLAARTPAEQIRRQYLRLVRKSPNLAKVRVSDTPREIEDVSLTRSRDAQIDQLHRLYEKARYSPASCTPADAAAMRQTVRSLSKE